MKILVADDDAVSRMIMERMLRQIGYDQLRRDRQRYVEDVGTGLDLRVGHVCIRCADLHLPRDGLIDA